MDEEIIKRIRSQTDTESLRQSLYDLLNLSDKSVAVSIAVEYTKNDKWMIRRNAIIVLGQLQDSRAAPILFEIIQSEINRKKKWVQVGDKGDDVAQDVDTHILKACVDSIIQCGNPEHILALSAYTDRLTYEWMFGEDTISKIKEVLAHLPKDQSQTASAIDLNKLRESMEEERRSWEAWLEEEKERLAKEQRVLWERERRLAEKERELKAQAAQTAEAAQSSQLPAVVVNEEIPDGYVVSDEEHLPIPDSVPGVQQIVIVTSIVVLAVAVIFVLLLATSTLSVPQPDIAPTPNDGGLYPAPTSPPSIVAKQYSDLAGRIMTSNGKGVPCAVIATTGAYNSGPLYVVDNDGYYTITGLPYGNYSITVWDSSLTSIICTKRTTINSNKVVLNIVQGTYE